MTNKPNLINVPKLDAMIDALCQTWERVAPDCQWVADEDVAAFIVNGSFDEQIEEFLDEECRQEWKLLPLEDRMMLAERSLV
jgi:hypothetical protein